MKVGTFSVSTFILPGAPSETTGRLFDIKAPDEAVRRFFVCLSEVSELAGFLAELGAEIGVRDGDEVVDPLADAAAT